MTRQRGPLKYEVKESREVSGDVISDEFIVLTSDETREKYAKPLRRIFAVVEPNVRKHDMVFLTNNLGWAAETICELYRARCVDAELRPPRRDRARRDVAGDRSRRDADPLWDSRTRGKAQALPRASVFQGFRGTGGKTCGTEEASKA